MCGLTGIVDLRERRPIDRGVLHRMNESLHHRGPDDGGLHLEPGVGLGHRRLSIIDLSNGHQPLFNEDNSVVVVYNGEIYNFQELAVELQALGHQFRTHCDTEVIVHAWEEWGEDCVQRFRGMFAFAIWDRNQQTLFLARDRLGIKPLYYALLPDGHCIFGSELKALTAYPGFSRELEPKAVEDYFAYGYVPEPKSIYRQAKKLSAGYVLKLRRGETPKPPRQYWDVPFADVGATNFIEAQEELVRQFREAVSVRLVSEVPLGAFLSGGVDSSAVVAMMAGLDPKPVNTCSISFGDPKYNEASFADQVAEQYHTDHRVQQVEPGDFSLVDRLAGLYDEPYADSSAMPTYRVCELARREVTVALSGDGGDENLAGYRRHRWHNYEERMRRLLPQWFRGPVFGALGEVYPKMDWAPRIFRAKYTLQGFARDSVAGYLHSVGIVPRNLREQLYSPSLLRELQGYDGIEVFRGYAENAPTDDPLSLVQYLDLKTYLPGDILTKVDRASMAHSLEVRVPLLDHHLVEWISGLPAAWKLKGREGKYVFKKALEKHLPENILYRPKMGFGVPLARWFREDLRQHVRDALTGETLSDSGLFQEKTVERFLDQHQSGLRDHSAILWSLLMFESFLRGQQGVGSTEMENISADMTTS